MLVQKARWSLFMVLAVLLFACGPSEKDMVFEVKVTLDGGPAEQARIVIDGVEVGATDVNGAYATTLKKVPNREVKVSVLKEAAGYRVRPWEGSFVVGKVKRKEVFRHSLQVVLEGVRIFTVRVTEKGQPVEGADVLVNGVQTAVTGTTGEFVQEFSAVPADGFKIQVAKKGYLPWQGTVSGKPGELAEAALARPVVLSFLAVTQEAGQDRPLEGVEVRVGKKAVGRTDGAGTFSTVHQAAPGTTVRLAMAPPGGMYPAGWSSEVVTEERTVVKRYFYSPVPGTVRMGIYGYSGNVAGEDLTGFLGRLQEAVGNHLYSFLVFKEVPSEELKTSIRQARTDIDAMTTKGWQRTSLARTVDAVILGSVSKDQDRYLVETKVYTSSGRLVLSQLVAARGEGDLKEAARRTARTIMDQYPFEGTVIARKGDLLQVNLGSTDHRLVKGAELALLAPTMDGSGMIQGYRGAGSLRVREVEKADSWASIVDQAGGRTPAVGDRVVRLIPAEEETKAAAASFILLARGGIAPDLVPIGGVNVYLNERWAGTTGTDGKVRVPAVVGKTYEMVLYRHGFQDVSEKLRVAKDGEVKEFALTANNALLRVESEPSGAQVFLDGAQIGRTPVSDPVKVGFGFHTLRLVPGQDSRTWEEVVEFNSREVNLTGPARVVFVPDYLRLGRQAEERGNVDEAISQYSRADRGHPDYSEIRFRLAQLYMDEKNDYPAAIREFEEVISLPQNRQLIFKQFSISYTNLGHAYYEVGYSLLQKDRNLAGQNLAKAVENLETAKQNTRFFPTTHYDEAVHDTYYYLALSYHKLYLLTRNQNLLPKADFAFREYVDFFPTALAQKDEFAQMKDSAQKYWAQIQDLM